MSALGGSEQPELNWRPIGAAAGAAPPSMPSASTVVCRGAAAAPAGSGSGVATTTEARVATRRSTGQETSGPRPEQRATGAAAEHQKMAIFRSQK
jgi:hypothetical protein